MNFLHASDCSSGEVRLVNGSNPHQGRVEVCYDGVWGTVCSDFWNSADAAVVCRQLGFSSQGAIEHRNAAFGEGTGIILLDDIRCTGLESEIFNCVHASITITNCRHHQDAGATCSAGMDANQSKQSLVIHYYAF